MSLVVVAGQFKNEETVQVLRGVLARAVRGEISGVVVAYKLVDGTEETAITGRYRAKPAMAVNAGMRISWRMTQLQDQLTGAP